MDDLLNSWSPHYLTVGIVALVLLAVARDIYDRLSGKLPPRFLDIPGRAADLDRHPLAFKIGYLFIALLVAALPYALIVGF